MLLEKECLHSKRALKIERADGYYGRAHTEMRCPDETQLIQFTEGKLGPDLHFDVVHHLESCPSCRRVVAGVNRSLALLSFSSNDPAAEMARAPRQLGR